jgi:alcohol dehydrogenase class IV
VFLTLPAVARFNYLASPADLAPGLSPAHIQKSFALLFRLFSVTDIDSLVGRLEEVLTRLHFQPRLSDYGIQSSDLRGLADQALTKGRSDNNPRRIDSDKIFQLLQQIF